MQGKVRKGCSEHGIKYHWRKHSWGWTIPLVAEGSFSHQDAFLKRACCVCCSVPQLLLQTPEEPLWYWSDWIWSRWQIDQTPHSPHPLPLPGMQTATRLPSELSKDEIEQKCHAWDYGAAWCQETPSLVGNWQSLEGSLEAYKFISQAEMQIKEYFPSTHWELWVLMLFSNLECKTIKTSALGQDYSFRIEKGSFLEESSDLLSGKVACLFRGNLT